MLDISALFILFGQRNRAEIISYHRFSEIRHELSKIDYLRLGPELSTLSHLAHTKIFGKKCFLSIKRPKEDEEVDESP